MYRPMRDYPERGGKRARPALVLLACVALGGDVRRALRTAAAFEMFQSFAVVHDDIEDGSEMRRGKPCLHHLHGIRIAGTGQRPGVEVMQNLLRAARYEPVEGRDGVCRFHHRRRPLARR